MGDVIFDGRRFSDFGVIVSGENTWAQPTRRVTKAQVPGRNGDLIVEAGEFNNVEISYPAGIMHDFDSYADGWEAFAQFLAVRSDRYYRLEDEYHPLYYRMARFVPGIAPKVGTLNRSGQFTVTFDCKPQKYLLSGENEIVLTDYTDGYGVAFTNPTEYDAFPEIQLTPKVMVEVISDSYDSSVTIEFTPSNPTEYEAHPGKVVYYTEISEAIWTYEVDGFEQVKYVTDQVAVSGTVKIHPGANSLCVFETFSGEIRDDIDIHLKPRWYTI